MISIALVAKVVQSLQLQTDQGLQLILFLLTFCILRLNSRPYTRQARAPSLIPTLVLVRGDMDRSGQVEYGRNKGFLLGLTPSRTRTVTM